MNTKFYFVIAAIAMSGSINSANAAFIVLDDSQDFPYELPSHYGMGNDVYLVTTNMSSMSFSFKTTDQYTNTIATFVGHNAPDFSGDFNWIFEGQLRLFRGVPDGSPSEMIESSRWGSPQAQALEVDYLPPGSYFWNIISGDISGFNGRAYLFSADIMQIPEPETFALLILGLGILGLTARQSRKQSPCLRLHKAM